MAMVSKKIPTTLHSSTKRMRASKPRMKVKILQRKSTKYRINKKVYIVI